MELTDLNARIFSQWKIRLVVPCEGSLNELFTTSFTRVSKIQQTLRRRYILTHNTCGSYCNGRPGEYSRAVWGEGAGCATRFSTGPDPHYFSDLAPGCSKDRKRYPSDNCIRETNCVIQWIAAFARLSYLTFKSCTWFASHYLAWENAFFSRMSTNFLLFGSLTQNGLLGAESWDKYVYTPSWFPWKPHQISHHYGKSLYSFSDQNVLNTIPSEEGTYVCRTNRRPLSPVPKSTTPKSHSSL